MPKPPSVKAFRSIGECRIRSVLKLFDGKTQMKMFTHISDSIGVTTYFIELVHDKPALVTYVNGKRVDVREIDI